MRMSVQAGSDRRGPWPVRRPEPLSPGSRRSRPGDGPVPRGVGVCGGGCVVLPIAMARCGDFGGIILHLEQALVLIATNRIFRTWTCMIFLYKVELMLDTG